MSSVVKLREVVLGATGSRNPTKSPAEHFVYVDVAAVDNSAKTITGARTVIGAEAPSRARKLIRSGDILVSTVRPNLNAVALVSSELDGQVASTGFCVLRALDKVLPEYLFYFTRSKPFVEGLSSLVAGALYPAVSDSQVLDQELPVPPLPEQRRIVDLLSRAEGIVRLRREAEKKAAELIPALFLDMFGDPGRNPKGWPVALLPDVLSRPFKNGLYLPKDKYAPEDSGTGVEMVHMSDAFYGEVKRGHLRRVLADQKQVLDYGLTSTDLLVARRSLTFDGAAKICGVPLSDEPLLFESSFIRLTPKLDVVRTVFLLNYLNSESTRKAYVLSRISGITISGINQAAMNQIPVLLPPVPLQNDFVSKANEVQSIQSQQSTATAKAKATFDALLAQAFSNNGANV